jgi:hypothetical protein
LCEAILGSSDDEVVCPCRMNEATVTEIPTVSLAAELIPLSGRPEQGWIHFRLLRFIQTAYDVVRRRCGGSSATPYDVVHVNCMLMPRSLCTVMNINEEKYELAKSTGRRTTDHVVRRRTT